MEPAGRGSEGNRQIAARLQEAAELLALQGANPFRVAAYRNAATTLEDLDEDIGRIAERAGIVAASKFGAPNARLSLASNDGVRCLTKSRSAACDGPSVPVAHWGGSPIFVRG